MFATPSLQRHRLLPLPNLAVGLSLLGGVGLVSAQQAFPPPGPDILQSPTLTMIDPEFNVEKKQVTWVDVATGDIWVASYNFTNGNFIPPTGQGVRIEAAVSTGGAFPGLGFTINGPEWAKGSSTDYIVYTRTNATRDPTPKNSLIGVAYRKPSGEWIRKSLTPLQRNGPFGSTNRNDVARISYQDAEGTHYVRAVSDATSEEPLPGLYRAGLTPAARFVDSANVVVYQLPYNGVQQAVAYDIDTKVLAQLTFDVGDKNQSWMWSAPESDGSLALATIAGKSTIAMYVPVVDQLGSVSYVPYASIKAPVGGQWYSLEPFVYQGRSYAIAQLIPWRSTYPTSIWMLGFDPTNPIRRQLTPNGAATEARADPELVPISSGAMVVYSKFDTTKCLPSDVSTWLCMQGLLGLFRADTGLPPPN